MWNSSNCDCECKEACKIDEYLDIKNYLCEKSLFDKLVLACQDEILNTTEASFDDKKVTCKKNNCPIFLISLVIIFLLSLTVVFISC